MSSMATKTVVVTGATTGIGLEAAKELARRGARVIITARDAAKGAAAVNAISEAGEGRVVVDVVACDFSSITSIRQAAAEIKLRTDRIDVLLNNAGAVYMERGVSKDGYELTFAVNHMGYFCFTDELLDLIKLSAPSRVVNVASDAHKAARNGISFDDLDRKQGYSGSAAYALSLLMKPPPPRARARRLEGSGVTVNCLHPGVIASGFGTNNRGLMGWATRKLGPIFLLTTEKGAQTSIYLCTSKEVDGVSGKYFAKSKVAKPTKHGVDDVAAKRLFELSEKISGAHTAYEPVVGAKAS
jgi:NAD(P)-dependent dehydrogenase (short-subunit alcohol dehydrogenase family)